MAKPFAVGIGVTWGDGVLTYLRGRVAGMALASGVEGSAMRNQKGVLIQVTSTLEGIKVKFAF